jgi:hypothetical protein
MGGLMLVEVFPIRPRTRLGWALFVVAGPLLWLAAEAFGTLLEREPVGRWIERETARSSALSFARVVYLLVRAAIVFCLIFVIGWLVNSVAPDFGRFLNVHFGLDA